MRVTTRIAENQGGINMNQPNNKANLMLISSLLIFSTIGIFRNYIPYPSSVVALARGVIGTLFILAVMLIKRQKLNFETIKKNLLLLCVSGAFIGFNWILLFEAYRHTSISTATLCYYMSPIMVILASPFVLKEKQTAKKLVCTLVAIVGMVIISGVFESGFYGIKGILFGLGAAALYAAAVLMNKFMHGISGLERTFIQIGTAAIAILPYVLLTENVTAIVPSAIPVVLLVIVGVLHTGLAYTLYFTSIEKINAQTVAIMSYIDPVVALILSFVIFKDDFGPLKLIGSILILGATLVSELPQKKKD